MEDSSAHVQIHKQFIQNKFGVACKICDTLWFEGNLKNFIHECRVCTNISSKCFHLCGVVLITQFFLISIALMSLTNKCNTNRNYGAYRKCK